MGRRHPEVYQLRLPVESSVMGEPGSLFREIDLRIAIHAFIAEEKAKGNWLTPEEKERLDARRVARTTRLLSTERPWRKCYFEGF